MTKEEAEYVYQSVNNRIHINRKVDKSVDVSVNPYKEALTQEVDSHLHEEPSLEMKKCDLMWSILVQKYITQPIKMVALIQR